MLYLYYIQIIALSICSSVLLVILTIFSFSVDSGKKMLLNQRMIQAGSFK